MQIDDAAWLRELGWNSDFAAALRRLGDPTLEPGRVGADHGAAFLVHRPAGPGRARLGRALLGAGRPVAVGDWVALRHAGDRPEIVAVLERRTAIRRKVPDVEAREQVLAANVDVVLIVSALDGDFNPRRVERLLAVVHQSGASPAVLLTKADLAAADAALAEVAAIAPGVPAVALSPLTGAGVDGVRGLVGPGRTAVLVGSSGVGKSTLVNRLAGSDALRTGAVHSSGQGRHTTSHRQLIVLPAGGVLIDTPGLREIQLWVGESALEDLFADIEALLLGCRFADCRHAGEPGCAAAAALADGTLDPGRWASFRKLQRELRAVELRGDARLRAEERRRWRALGREARRNLAARQGWG